VYCGEKMTKKYENKEVEKPLARMGAAKSINAKISELRAVPHSEIKHSRIGSKERGMVR